MEQKWSILYTMLKEESKKEKQNIFNIYNGYLENKWKTLYSSEKYYI